VREGILSEGYSLLALIAALTLFRRRDVTA